MLISQLTQLGITRSTLLAPVLLSKHLNISPIALVCKGTLKGCGGKSKGDSGAGKIKIQRAERSGPCRLGFIPDEWFLFFHSKTGVSGPYVFGIVVANYMLSKEIYVLEHEYYLGLSAFLVIYLLTTRLGPGFAAYLDKGVDEISNQFAQSRKDEIAIYEDIIKQAKDRQWRAEGQKDLMSAKKENIAMQLEAEYRERMMRVYHAVRGRMDYHVKKHRAEARIQQKWMTGWILENVNKSITPELQQQALTTAINDLAAAASRNDILTVPREVYCKFQLNSYDCSGNGTAAPRFYFDLKMQSCKTSTDGGCNHNLNSFSTLLGCHDNCLEGGQSEKLLNNITANIFCRLQPDFGKCNDYIPMYYFDLSERRCKGFSFSGCGGNYNRFPNAQMCAEICFTAVDYSY